MTTTQQGTTEIWFIHTKSGQKQAYRWSFAGDRAVRVPMAEVELGLTAGTMVEVGKPEWVGK